MTLVERRLLGVLVLGYGEHTDHQVQIFLHGYTCVLIKLLLRALTRWKKLSGQSSMKLAILKWERAVMVPTQTLICAVMKCGYWYLHSSQNVNLNVVFLLLLKKDFKIPYSLTRISPVSFSWRTNILLQLFSLLHLSARTSGFSFSAIRRILTEM